MGKVVLIIAPEEFRDEELFHTKEEIEKNGHETTIASINLNIAKGSRGGSIKPEIILEKISVDDFDGIVFVGGVGAQIYFNNKKALSLAKEFFEQQKIVSAICIAPIILANAGLLENKKVTSYESAKKSLENHGAIFTGNGIEVDGKIITASGPKSAYEFGKKISELI